MVPYVMLVPAVILVFLLQLAVLTVVVMAILIFLYLDPVILSMVSVLSVSTIPLALNVRCVNLNILEMPLYRIVSFVIVRKKAQVTHCVKVVTDSVHVWRESVD